MDSDDAHQRNLLVKILYAKLKRDAASGHINTINDLIQTAYKEMNKLHYVKSSVLLKAIIAAKDLDNQWNLFIAANDTCISSTLEVDILKDFDNKLECNLYATVIKAKAGIQLVIEEMKKRGCYKSLIE